MAILGNTVKGNVTDQGSGKVLTEEQVRQIQRVLLMMLEDIDETCRENDLDYILIGGTAIGCVRHKGFIPWDDDVDIAMTRANYEKFLRAVKKKYPDKYHLTDAIRENNYGKNIPKLRLNGTVYKTLLKVNPNDREITADIFIIENVEDNTILKNIHGIICLAFGYFLSCRRLADKEIYFREIYKERDFKRKVFLGKVLSFASLDKWAKWNEEVYSWCRNDNSRYVSVPTDRRHFLGEIFPREIMCETIDAEYEGKKFKIPRAYDYYLSHRYGNYMEIPPKEKQVLSVYSELSFGSYKDLAIGKSVSRL